MRLAATELNPTNHSHRAGSATNCGQVLLQTFSEADEFGDAAPSSKWSGRDPKAI
ncbi:MAG: hypothetical protein M3371_13650 [Acidobacteriota bacterium]|nr:hypothetical protein [Acidobacteriota bacterium]